MARTGTHKWPYNCSFCGKNQDQVERLIAGPNGVYICDECIKLCYQILTDETVETDESAAPHTPPDTPDDDQPGQWRATVHRV